MDDILEIDKETIVVCNKYTKKMILDMHKLMPIKFMSIHELISKLCFSYDEDAIIFLMDKYKIKYDIALEYINNIYYVLDKKYDNSKLDFLVGIKHELEEHGLLIYNDNFREYAKRTPIILYDIELSPYLKRILNGLNYKVVNRTYNKYLHKVYEFNTMEDEIYFVAHKIASLIDGGVDTRQIKLTNVDSSYYTTIERIFSLFNIRVNISYSSLFSSFPSIQEFIKLYRENDIEYALNNSNVSGKLYDELVKVINKYLRYDNKELLIYKLEHSYIFSDNYSNGIEVIDYLEYISNENEYIFMIGFNDSLIPKKIMDTNYITDNICSMVGLNNTRIINKKLRIDTLNFINDTCNLYITYKLKDFKSNYYPSTLISNFEVVREEVDNVSYSATFDKMRLVKMYDDFIKYGYKNNNLGLLNSNYKIKYNSYSNKFSGIDRVMDKLTLSYSKMQMYNKCAFRYYLANILKLDIYEANFSTTIGSMVHFVMEKCLANNDMNIDKYVSLYLGDTIFSKKESFFLEKYKESIKELMDQVMLEKKYSLFDKAMYEKKIDIDYGDNIHFVGVIDKILYYIDNNSTYIGLIDYKTGADDISLKYLDYGLNIQLPIYLYLSTRLDFNNVKCVGFYLQKFNITNKDYRLVGYSNSDKDILTVLDNNYDNSKIVKGLKTLKDGSFSRYSMVLSSEEMDNIRDKVEKIISDVIDKIKNNQFEINPKVTIDKDIGCEFCKFKDICFRTKDDEVIIQPHEYGGE